MNILIAILAIIGAAFILTVAMFLMLGWLMSCCEPDNKKQFDNPKPSK